ncbi:MAG: thioredoxin family protein [Alphaproteobacteria bacterium]
MMAVETPVCDFGWRAVDFRLRGVDGRDWSLADVRGARGTLVMFLCNHCPYVRAVIDRIVRDVGTLHDHGIGAIAIMPNDSVQYPEDSFDAMAEFARRHAFPFPYVIDETQEVARAYGAACTPDFFGFDADLGLQYRGRLDASRKEAAPPDVRRDLFEAMTLVAATGHGPRDQIASIGCSIKWREDDPR